jgi:hypothetical protein
MRNNLILVLGALFFAIGICACEKYESDTYDFNNGRTANYLTLPIDDWQTDTLAYNVGDTINVDESTILSSRVAFPDTITAKLVLHAASPGIPDITYVKELLPQQTSWSPSFPIPDDYLPTGTDSTFATLRLVSASGPVTGSLKIGYLPDDMASIPMYIYR